MLHDNGKLVKGLIDKVKGTTKEVAGTVVGNETLEAKGSIQKSVGQAQAAGTEVAPGFHYKVVEIYPKFADVGDALFLLKKEGFTDEQISLLGREQAHWQETLGHEWGANKTKGALAGAAWGAVPGLVLVTGLALTGGAGLLVVGPMFGAMSALGMGALAGGLMGAGSNAVGRKLSIEEEIAEAIDAGQWVIVVHCHTEAEVARAQGVLSDRRILREAEPKTIAPSEVAALEQIDVNKLAAVVQDAFLPLTKLSTIPIEEVMCDFEKIDAPELKQAAEKALKQIATATGLSTTQVTDIFKANRFTNTNIVGCLYEQSGVKRQHI